MVREDPLDDPAGEAAWSAAMTSDDVPAQDRFDKLEALIQQRRGSDPATSYVAALRHQGRAKMAQKLGEEAVETVISAVADDAPATIKEAADLVFHLACLLADMDLSFADIFAELERRDGVSGLAEKAAR